MFGGHSRKTSASDAGDAQKTHADMRVVDARVVDAYAMESAMEDEIAQVIARHAQEKLALLEEIELREIQEATARMDAERADLLAEIARRETQHTSEPTTPRTSEPTTPQRERRHAIRLGKTLAQRAAQGDATAQGVDEKMAKEIQEINALNKTGKLQIDEVSGVKRPVRNRSLRKSAVRGKNASLRAVSHNATRKNLWIADVPQALVHIGNTHFFN